MLRLRHKLLIHLLRLADQAILLAGLLLISIPVYESTLHGTWESFTRSTGTTEAAGLLLLGFASLAIFNQFIRYEANRFTPLGAEVRRIVAATTMLSIAVVTVAWTLGTTQPTLARVILFYVLSTVMLALLRVGTHALLAVARRSGWSDRHLLIVGCNQRALDLAGRFASSPTLGYKVVGFVCESPDCHTQVGPIHPVLGHVGQLQDILRKGTVDEVAICTSAEAHFPIIMQVIAYCRDLGIVVRVIPDANEDRILRETQFEFFDGHYVITIFREHLIFQLLLKRLFDVSVSALLLILLSPLLVAVAIAIKVTSPGPVFFVQERVAMNKRRFRLFKFRSMVVDAEARKRELAHLNEMDGPVFKIKNDPRITTIGRFIRRTSIDELPQLLNVLQGTMSLVGPRPPVPAEVEKYEWLFQHRLSIKPGITCLWQISGRNQITFAEWMELDRRYIENWSLWLDIKILFKTIPAVLFARGAS